MYRLPCKDPAALSSKSWLQHTADSHVFSSVHIDSKIFPRLFSGFSVTDEIWTLPEGNQCLLDTLPSSGPWLRCGWFETHFCPFNQPFQSLRSHWHPATDVAVTVRSSINASKKQTKKRVRSGQGTPAFHFCCLDKQFLCRGKRGHWYGANRDDAFL